MNRIEYADKIADMFKRSRNIAGKSQDYVAKALGVSKKTVQNWEAGLASPNVLTCFEWFDILGLPAYPYLVSILHGDNIEAKDDEAHKALQELIMEMSDASCKKLLYLLCGAHGSNPKGVIEMLTAYLQTPLAMRLNIAFSIMTNYDVCKAGNMLVNPSDIEPNAELLQNSAEAGKKAVLEGKGSYTFIN